MFASRVMTAMGALLAGAALALAACSDGSGDPTGSGGGAGSGAGTESAGSGGSSASQQPGGGGGDATASPAGSDPPPRLMRYLTSVTDRSLRVELDSVSGLEPYESSTAYLGDKFSALLEKPDGVTFEADETLEPAGEGYEWTFERLDEYARAHATDDGAGPVTIHVLSLDGRYVSEQGSGTVLGLAWGQRFIALFQDPIRSPCASGVLGSLQQENCEIAERNVWAHEIGHVIGLVDNGVTMGVDHRDAEHGHHDVSDECLMYWAYDGPQIFDTLLGRIGSGRAPDLEFCSQCQADIAAVR